MNRRHKLPTYLRPRSPHGAPNQCLLFTTRAHTIATCFAVVSILYHLFLVFSGGRVWKRKNNVFNQPMSYEQCLFHRSLLGKKERLISRKHLAIQKFRTIHMAMGLLGITSLQPSNETGEPTTSQWMKQSTWLRTALCGGWCLRMALLTLSGACQKRRRTSLNQRVCMCVHTKQQE